MAVVQAASVTLAKSGAVASVTEYHFKAASSSIAPAKPTTKDPSAGWYSTVPAWSSGTRLYVATRTDLVDGTFLWSDVTEDPTWANAGAAKAKAEATEQYFYADSSGAHVVSGLDSSGKAQGTRLDMSSEGLSIKDAATLAELSSFGVGAIDLGSDNDATIKMRNGSVIEASEVENYNNERFTALRVASGSVDVSAEDVAHMGASACPQKAPDGSWLDGYASEITLSGSCETYDPEGDLGRAATPTASVEIRTSTVESDEEDSDSKGFSNLVSAVSTWKNNYVGIYSGNIEAIGNEGVDVTTGSAVEVTPYDIRLETGYLRLMADDEVSVEAPDLVSISHATSGKPPIGIGFGAGGDNRGLSANISGSENDGFTWLLAVSDSNHYPIIPGLYHGDSANCSIRPVYTGYVTYSSLASGSSKSGTVSLSCNGYSPLGVIGTDVSQSGYPAHVLVNSWVTDRQNGKGVLHYTIKNTTSSSANTCKVRWHVLWARQTDINGTYVS